MTVEKIVNKLAAILGGTPENRGLISKKYSIIVVPDKNERIINKNVSGRLVLITCLLAISFVATSLYFAFGFINTTIDRKQMSNLGRENEFLSGKINELENTVHDLRSEMSTLMEKDDYIRMVFDLPPLDSELREVGIGGFTYEEPQISSELAHRTWMVEEDVEKIQRQLELENASFKNLALEIEGKRNVLDHTPTIRPTEGVLSRGFGMHNDPFTGIYQPHNGIDIAGPKGTSIYATADGIVRFAGYKTKLGNTVVIDHGNGIRTYYGHLSKFKVNKGQRVKRHDRIGEMGSSGYSTGSHLHYEVRINRRAVNPYRYILSTYIS
ncbi:MAG: peptidoglycan DD-metalloendopeptidase family protein [Candidatus Zixiibacteriota bacterium]|nr:MAG: peptidoglycan DD-metalloendopeptidase family protein [candidate division Zixibacteria bacterium]